MEISIVGTTVFELSTAELELSRWSSLKVYPHTPYNDFHLHYLEYADGVFGANPQAGGFRSLFYHDEDLSYSSDSNFVFSLDLNDATDQITAYGEGEGGAYGKSDADSDSELHIDGMSDQYRDSLQWSAATAVLEGDSAYYPHSLEIHAMQVCGIDLINAAAGTASSASSSTTASATTTAALPKPVFSAIVDTASTCLSLPREVFDILKGWLPMDCEAVRGALPTSTPEHCFLPPSVTPVLPTIDLKISADGDWLHLPVAALLRDENSGTATKAGSRRVCVTRDYSYATQEVEGKPNIIFGNMALKAFYASFAMNPQRVGLANKVTATPSTVQCLQTIDCHGMQTLYEPLNVCVQPACHNYFFFTLNAAGDECELTQMFHILAFSFLSLFVIVEITLLEVQKRLSHLALQPEVSGHFG